MVQFSTSNRSIKKKKMLACLKYAYFPVSGIENQRELDVGQAWIIPPSFRVRVKH